MAVTEKCDVYSFGVLAFEVLMGKHPEELISCLQSEAAVKTFHYKNVLDRRLSPPICRNVGDKLASVMKTAVSCSMLANPQSRPTMPSVTKLLEMQVYADD
ncbi:hypothetical protein TIFTF001_046282 [Ficus carica]|uniref:non-specific serine/threonine protein kinase n=1 Tax=Ficus carica TaxID=3494 RepID=A0AA87Z3F2_FICCA|nr:hypothetical protein TIFTF001_046282 [Ficus carica]